MPFEASATQPPQPPPPDRVLREHGMNYMDALTLRKNWVEHISDSSEALSTRLGPNSWRFCCGVCGVEMWAGVSVHIRSQKHRRVLLERLSSFPRRGGEDEGDLPPAHIAVQMDPGKRPWVQIFCPVGEHGPLVLFNHITGGMVEYTGGFRVRPSRPPTSLSQPTSKRIQLFSEPDSSSQAATANLPDIVDV